MCLRGPGETREAVVEGNDRRPNHFSCLLLREGVDIPDDAPERHLSNVLQCILCQSKPKRPGSEQAHGPQAKDAAMAFVSQGGPM